MVPKGQRALVVLIQKEIGLEPLALGRADLRGNIAVERDDAPLAGVEAVVAEPRRSGDAAEVLEVWRRSRRFVVVVARRWTRAAQMPAPRRVVAIAKIFRSS